MELNFRTFSCRKDASVPPSVVLHTPHHLYDYLFREPWSACVRQRCFVAHEIPAHAKQSNCTSSFRMLHDSHCGVITTVPHVALMTATKKQLRTPPCIDSRGASLSTPYSARIDGISGQAVSKLRKTHSNVFNSEQAVANAS